MLGIAPICSMRGEMTATGVTRGCKDRCMRQLGAVGFELMRGLAKPWASLALSLLKCLFRDGTYETWRSAQAHLVFAYVHLVYRHR